VQRVAVDERLERGPRLPPGAGGPIEPARRRVVAADQRPHLARAYVERHQRRLGAEVEAQPPDLLALARGQDAHAERGADGGEPARGEALHVVARLLVQRHSPHQIADADVEGPEPVSTATTVPT
jgi:hypothetical protein